MHVRADRPGKHLCFDIASKRNIVLGALLVGDTDNVLLEDRPFIQVGRRVVGCGHAAAACDHLSV